MGYEEKGWATGGGPERIMIVGEYDQNMYVYAQNIIWKHIIFGLINIQW